jgi:glycosyltransferase involved in cell wall biosynthesis
LKILHISSAQTLGGGERHLIDLANALVARGHEVFAVVRPASPLIAELTGLPRENIVTMPLRNALDAPSARSLARAARKHEIEIVHAHMARDYPLASYAVRRNPGARLIITRHVLFPLNRLHTITLSHAARVIAVSEAVARELRAQGLVPLERIVVVPNGIDVQRFDNAKSQFDRAAFRRRWKISEDCLLVGTVGEIKSLKGPEDFVRAAAIVVNRFPNAHFLIAGQDSSRTGEQRAALEDLIAKLDLAKQVHLLGWLDDVAPFYCAVEVFVSASQSESFGLAIAEAMACGTAVVATETEGAKEIIENGETGLLVPVGGIEALATAIIGLLENNDKRNRLATVAREVVQERFRLERIVDVTEEIYREVLVERSDGK